MAPIKFEEQIKDKLDQRTIQPSKDAWEQLSNKLNSEEKKKSKRLYFYVGIAASIIGVLLMSHVMFNTSENQTIVPTVVEAQDEKKEIDVLNPNTQIDNSSNSNVTATDSQENNRIENKEETPSHISSIKNEPKVTIASEQSIKMENASKNDFKPKEQIKKITEDAVAIATISNVENTNDKNIENSKNILKPASALTFEEAKALQVVAEIKKLEIENGSVTDIEIENLLKQAEKDILRNKIFNETTRTVDADALLQDVEQDLEKSFRTKVFESLKSSYKTVKTAVAERNN